MIDWYPNQPVPLEERGSRDEALPTCALAECTCPDFCERDHANE